MVTTKQMKQCDMRDEILKGNWIATAPSKKSFFCCEIRNGMNGTDEELQYCGPAKHSHQFTGSKTFNPPAWSACSCDAEEGRTTVNPREKYVWQPDSCDMMAWDGSKFCSLLGNHVLLLVGDSTMQQTASTLMSMITNWFLEAQDPNQSCAEQIHYALSDILVANYGDTMADVTGTKHVGLKRQEFERGHPVRRYVKLINPDMVVVSAGPHFYDNNRFVTMIKFLTSDIAMLQREAVSAGKKLLFAWKSQVAL